ncbi:hypothetical protein [Lacinutrix chionoecetis]
MLIIPQISSSRFLIVVSLCTFIVLSVSMISNRLELEDENYMLEQEKNLMLYELSEMIDIYDTVSLLKDTLRLQLEHSKVKLISTIDSINKLEPNEQLVNNLKSRIAQLKKKNAQILFNAGLKENEINKLRKEKNEFKKILKTRDSLTNIMASQYELFYDSEDVSDTDTEHLNTLFISNLNVKGTKRITSKGRVVDTRYARKTKKFHVEFTFVKNKYLSKGNKTLYFQVLHSNMTVVSSQGTVSFGEKSLIYSKKKSFYYNGEESVVSAIIENEGADNLKKGTYFVNVIYNGEILASKSVILK